MSLNPSHQPIQAAVIGAGSWGTALASLLAGKLPKVTLWCLETEVAEEINRTHKNPLYVSDFTLPDNLVASNDLLHTATHHNLLILVVPTQFTRRVLQQLQPVVQPETRFVYASKGVEVETLTLISDMHRDIFGAAHMAQACFLSGPSFAREVLQQLPTAVAIAGSDPQTVHDMQRLFHTPTFRTYRSDDVIGVELGGAMKNVIALAAGISDGLGFGNGARAALLTRGLAEIVRLGVALGANAETFSGLSGMGDLLLTATSTLSRNYSVGWRLGQGETLEKIQAGSREVAEGVKTTLGVRRLAEKLTIDMPITQAVHTILYDNRDPRAIVRKLMERDLKAEQE
ncbi:MAG: NAD(P)-dependent glycerol-3-phosphate dehydrogenase [Magnetococcales bacterium]|nr:NAD(P)-dependent glycerol-3-phosphate dehydrogenase [Magnetococcales bacterium]MBF0115616.1 NAD(P)-dependent glycerol-3-phosphate dehydrogenase [Magnetococcales bacterium]